MFIAVGCVAAFVHWAVVVGLVQQFALAPLAANMAGWAIAFCVSFAGQSTLTFGDHRAPLLQAARRFLALSLAGFGINEAAYALLLRYSSWRYDVLLALVLAGVAVVTYLMSQRWAFRRT